MSGIGPLHPEYRPDRLRAFLAGSGPVTPSLRLAQARETAGLLRDQFRVLRTVGANVTEALTGGPVSLDERRRIAELLDMCVEEIGGLVQTLQSRLSTGG